MACENEKINIILGKKKDFDLTIRKGDDAYDLTGLEVKVCLPGATAPVELTSSAGELTIADAVKGKVTGTIPSAKSSGLVVGEDQSIQVEVGPTGGDFEADIIEEALTVEESLC